MFKKGSQTEGSNSFALAGLRQLQSASVSLSQPLSASVSLGQPQSASVSLCQPQEDLGPKVAQKLAQTPQPGLAVDLTPPALRNPSLNRKWSKNLHQRLSPKLPARPQAKITAEKVQNCLLILS